MALSGAPFHQTLVDMLLKQGFRTPSAVQACAWPAAMAGFDVLAVALTGSGKTLGYLLPALTRCHEILAQPKSKGRPRCLVMAPTRELVLQIAGEAAKYGNALGIRTVAVYGGAAKWEQAQQLQAGCEVVVATPGRLMDLQNLHDRVPGGGDEAGESGYPPATSLATCGMLVLDEADRMLDMGFEHDIRAIVKTMPKRRLVSLFTATWPAAVQRVASDLLARSHVKISIGTSGERLSANAAVSQIVHVVSPEEKWGAFVRLLVPFRSGGELASKRVLIFANTRADVAAIGAYCQKKQFAAETLSRDREQADRDKVIRQFRSGHVRMLIATDVAARGLDIQGIERVINFDFPAGGAEDYIHRIGRTGRAGAKGQADTLFTLQTDSKAAVELVRILRDAQQPVPTELAVIVRKKAKKEAKGEAEAAQKKASSKRKRV
jgi:ATP-dependent RNA helicase DDX5/DBP2